MPSVSNKQHNLMAACANGAGYKKCPPKSVARDYMKADQGGGFAGGGSPKEMGMDAKMNFGLGHGKSMFSTMPLMGHAMSGTQLGQADNAIRSAQKRFAEGGKVAKPAGPSAKERKEIRSMIERGKDNAIGALRSTRAALAASMPEQVEPEDFTVSLDRLRQNSAPIAMAGGGEVENPNDAGVQTSPAMLYQEYHELLDKLQNPGLDPSLQTEIVDRLAQIESALEAVGVDVGTPTE